VGVSNTGSDPVVEYSFGYELSGSPVSVTVILVKELIGSES